MPLDPKKAKNLAKLTPEELQVMANNGTERPFSGSLLYNDKQGTYNCRACNQNLFSSNNKIDTGTGWPSFNNEIPGTIVKSEDNSYGMHRIALNCSNCGAHLGHLFDYGSKTKPKLEYCINSTSLEFKEV